MDEKRIVDNMIGSKSPQLMRSEDRRKRVMAYTANESRDERKLARDSEKRVNMSESGYGDGHDYCSTRGGLHCVSQAIKKLRTARG